MNRHNSFVCYIWELGKCCTEIVLHGRNAVFFFFSMDGKGNPKNLADAEAFHLLSLR